MPVFSKVLRAGEGRKVKNLAAVVPLINAEEEQYERLSDEELAHLTVEFRERLAQGEDLNDLLVEAFAAVRESAKRTIGQRHFDVQLMGVMALHFGWIAEMRTGEGKTLVSTAPAYLNALEGNGVHIVTVNEYLAKRDSEWMGRIFKALGLTVGLVSAEAAGFDQKRAAYAADITYGTNTELGFDYLRDNMATNRDQMVQRGFNYAIVDEVDSILIDEARTPLIISGPSNESTRLYYQFASIARTLVRDKDYEVDEEKKTVVPTEDGIEVVERQLGVENLYDSVAVNYVHQLTKALEAKELYKKDDEYIVSDGEVKIVDEFTGRILEGRRWSDGLHQAVEAKERVRINEENHTWATVTLQNYFRMYDKLAGMTGTAETEAAEFASTYGLEVVPIPTHRPMVRVDQADLIFKTEEAKFAAVVDDIIERHDRGQPVLVGTASVEKSEQLSRLLDKQGVPHTVLNAKYHEREGQIVAQAGRLHGVTVATNMAGRGVDILLGGNPAGLAEDALRSEGIDPQAEEAAPRLAELTEQFRRQTEVEGEKIRELGGLYVLGSERHESRRIDNQLRGRSGRQGDPGESRFFLSLEDELMRLFATGAMSWVMDRALPDDVPIEARMVTRAIEKAQNTVEQKNAEVRKDVLKYDEVMNEQRKVVYERRMQVIDGEELRERTLELLEQSIDRVIGDTCGSEFPEEWDLDQLVPELQQYYPTKFSVADLRQAESTEQLYESVTAEAIDFYETREQEMGAELIRELERHVMMQIIDQRWRLHLSEMDYLREGIHLRGIAQTDPLVAWQREGYEMFGKLMDSIDDDYLKFVTHLELVPAEEAPPDLAEATYEAAEDPVVEPSLGPGTPSATSATPAEETQPPEARPAEARPARVLRQSAPAGAGAGVAGRSVSPGPSPAGAPTTKLGRNDPCWCGSGKKFKVCHGRG